MVPAKKWQGENRTGIGMGVRMTAQKSAASRLDPIGQALATWHHFGGATVVHTLRTMNMTAEKFLD
jgi:hypothetical protein